MTAGTVTPPVIVNARGVEKKFGPLHVLKRIDLTVHKREVVVIVGASGSGKTTFIRCINHLEKIDGGRIEVNGHLIGYRERGGVLREDSERNIAFQRREIGMVFQNFELFPHLTALENIILAPIQVKGVPKQEAMEMAKGLLTKVRIPEKADFYPDELSGGQQQRVAIARALAMKPKMMFYDEPTSALDPEMIKEVLDVIQALSREGMTSMIVTHEMAFARRVADRVMFMDGGRIVDNAPTADFFGGETSHRARSFLEQILYH